MGTQIIYNDTTVVGTLSAQGKLFGEGSSITNASVTVSGGYNILSTLF
jgi:hypothetical protein